MSKGRTLGKTYGIKLRCFWELREVIVNLMGTHWELERNMLRTNKKLKKIEGRSACSTRRQPMKYCAYKWLSNNKIKKGSALLG
jgi:hypothetical protein